MAASKVWVCAASTLSIAIWLIFCGSELSLTWSFSIFGNFDCWHWVRGAWTYNLTITCRSVKIWIVNKTFSSLNWGCICDTPVKRTLQKHLTIDQFGKRVYPGQILETEFFAVFCLFFCRLPEGRYFCWSLYFWWILSDLAKPLSCRRDKINSSCCCKISLSWS